MKKLVLLILIGAVAALSFADDALVLPKGVLRLYEANSFIFFNAEYDADGEKQEIPEDGGRMKMVNIGGAAEYGVTDWMSAAVQWAPGWNVWSTVDSDDNLTLNGGFDVFAGAKIQVLGSQGLVANETMRLALAPGVKIPLPSPDWKEQFENMGAGDTFRGAGNDNHTLGLGGRAYFDWILTPAFYVNLYGEFIYYFPKTYEDVNLGTYIEVQMLKAFDMPYPEEFSFGYSLTAEVEPHYDLLVGEGMRLGLGLPVIFEQTPEVKIDDEAVADSGSYLLSVKPTVSLFLMKTFIPVELELSYSLPLLGDNTFATNVLTLQLKSYLKFTR
jgi:hypothetical protein